MCVCVCTSVPSSCFLREFPLFCMSYCPKLCNSILVNSSSSYVKSALKAICYGTTRTVLGSSTLKLNPLRVKCHCVMCT